MLTSSDQKQYKAFVKKLDNGFGLKMINTSNGIENVLIITSDSVLQPNNKSTVNSQNSTLMPILSKFSQETVRSEPIASFTNSNLAINRILTHLEPYLKELKPDIAGFHVFEKDISNSEPNTQKASVIVVANTKLAREKGVNINIPGKLMRVLGKDKKNNTPFEADSLVKPVTIIVGDYIININICYDVPVTGCKTTGTQTRRGLLFASSADDDTVYNIEPLFYVPTQTEHKESQTESSVSQTKCIQTERNILTSQTVQTLSVMLVNDCSTQTESVMERCSQESVQGIESADANAIIESFYLPNVKPGLDNNIDTNYQLISKRSKQSVTNAKSFSSLYTFNSHTKFMFDTFNSHTKFNEGKSSLDTSVSRSQTQNSYSSVPASSVYNLTTSMGTLTDDIDKQNNTTENPETKTTIIFENFPENITPDGSNDYLQIGTDTSSFDTMHQHSSTKLEPNILHTEKGKMRISAGNNSKYMGGSKSNISIKEIKEHLNQTTLSLYQLYSVVEFIEDLSTKPPGENVDFIRKENTTGKLCSQNVNLTNCTETITGESLETKAVLENQPPQDTLCDRCGLFFLITMHHECIKDHQITDGKCFNYTDTDYKFVDNPKENHMSCHHVCIDITSISSETNLSKSNKHDTTCSAPHCLTNTILNTGDTKLSNSLIFYNTKYESTSKSSHETNFKSNPTHIEEKKENHTYNVDQNDGNLNKFINNMIKEPNICNETGLADKIHKSKKKMQCNNFHQNEHRNNNITEHNAEELLLVMPLSKDKDITVYEDTLASSQKRQIKFTDISKSMNNLPNATAINGIREKRNNSSTTSHMFNAKEYSTESSY
ncbi:uncharacterized protein LOC124358144 [Homalodisca vitripennis]|uniref:uncharacterized protein LOC124358144 n=1 Tax=Homalodisca vitripennis TaxID=197043 RepID=UPI001EEBE4AB|nr:uncharacterized protein LOC124358144 [Homalodisca vitripennis]